MGRYGRYPWRGSGRLAFEEEEAARGHRHAGKAQAALCLVPLALWQAWQTHEGSASRAPQSSKYQRRWFELSADSLAYAKDPKVDKQNEIVVSGIMAYQSLPSHAHTGSMSMAFAVSHC